MSTEISVVKHQHAFCTYFSGGNTWVIYSPLMIVGVQVAGCGVGESLTKYIPLASD